MVNIVGRDIASRIAIVSIYEAVICFNMVCFPTLSASAWFGRHM